MRGDEDARPVRWDALDFIGQAHDSTMLSYPEMHSGLAFTFVA
jgi:hypothetical protein